MKHSNTGMSGRRYVLSDLVHRSSIQNTKMKLRIAVLRLQAVLAVLMLDKAARWMQSCIWLLPTNVFSSYTLPKPKSGKPQKSLTPACSGCSLHSSHVLADTMYESKPLEVLTANHLFPSHFPMDCEQTHSSQIAQNLNF